MHPLEQLRYVTKGWEGGEVPVQDVAAALADLAMDSPASLLQACRRLIEHFPAEGVAWWLCARALSAPDPVDGIWEAADEIASDPTPRRLAEALKRSGTEPVVVKAQAAGPTELLVSGRTAWQASAARRAGKELWAMVPRGVLLPKPLWRRLLRLAGQAVTSLTSDDLSSAVGEHGEAPLAEVLSGPTCPAVAELLDWDS